MDGSCLWHAGQIRERSPSNERRSCSLFFECPTLVGGQRQSGELGLIPRERPDEKGTYILFVPAGNESLASNCRLRSRARFARSLQPSDVSGRFLGENRS